MHRSRNTEKNKNDLSYIENRTIYAALHIAYDDAASSARSLSVFVFFVLLCILSSACRPVLLYLVFFCFLIVMRNRLKHSKLFLFAFYIYFIVSALGALYYHVYSLSHTHARFTEQFCSCLCMCECLLMCM